MNHTIDFETNTLIVGGGPAGSTLARILAQNNIETILIEKNFNFDKPCGGGIKSIVWNEFNIPKEFETKKITKFNLVSKRNKVFVDLSKTPISIVLRKEFDHKLRLLAQNDGVKLIEAKYIDSEHYEDFVISKIKIKEDYFYIKSNYLVAADGVKSNVRKKVLNNYTNSLLTHYTLIDNKDIDYCDFYFGKEYSPNEYAWVFPHGNKLSLGSVLKDENAKDIFKKFKDTEYNDEKIKGYHIPFWNDEKIFYKNRTFFVGDAAGHVLPFTYEGIYFAMSSAKILSQAIIEKDPKIYEKNWNKKYLKKFKFFKLMQKIFLANDYFVDLLVKFFNKKEFVDKALKHWEGKVEPTSPYKIPVKIIKYMLRK